VIAAGNIGCAIQIDRRASIPVVRTVELIDWAIGGPISLAPTHPSIIKEDV
jgi:glycolate oxidase iron-sulfur subunit